MSLFRVDFMANGEQAGTASASTTHWQFFRAGDFEQVMIRFGADLQALEQLDKKLWASLSCPVHGLEFDTRTPTVMAMIAFASRKFSRRSVSASICSKASMSWWMGDANCPSIRSTIARPIAAKRFRFAGRHAAAHKEIIDLALHALQRRIGRCSGITQRQHAGAQLLRLIQPCQSRLGEKEIQFRGGKPQLPFGTSLTALAVLPPGSERPLGDPFAEKRFPWEFYLLGVVLFLGPSSSIWPGGVVWCARLGVTWRMTYPCSEARVLT